MIDFHSHILPCVDDGAESTEISLEMLRRSFQQGVDILIATPHFYADEDYPGDFLSRRNEAFRALNDTILVSPEAFPLIILGSEVLYFPGISEAEEIGRLTIGSSRTILLEPPMMPWTDSMLDELSRVGENFHCTPIVAHVDRYMQYLGDNSLMERVKERNMLVQVNTSYLLNTKTAKNAVQNLKKGNIDLIGTDCHNLASRGPNMAQALKQARMLGVEAEFQKLHQNALDLLRRRS